MERSGSSELRAADLQAPASPYWREISLDSGERAYEPNSRQNHHQKQLNSPYTDTSTVYPSRYAYERQEEKEKQQDVHGGGYDDLARVRSRLQTLRTMADAVCAFASVALIDCCFCCLCCLRAALISIARRCTWRRYTC